MTPLLLASTGRGRGASSGGGGVALTFYCDWSAGGTGATENAIRNNGQWTEFSSNNLTDVAAIITSATAGLDSVLPTYTGNVYRLTMADSFGVCMPQTQVFPVASTTHWGRMWVKGEGNGSRSGHSGAYNNLHPDSQIQAMPWTRDARTGAGEPGTGFWRCQLGTGGTIPDDVWQSPNLTNGTWYRYEWEFEYVTATTFKIWPRIYSIGGTLLYDSDDYVNWEGASSLTSYWSTNGAGTLASGSGTDASLARKFGLGNEGPAGAPDTGDQWFIAGLAFSTEGWIGETME